MTRRAKWFVSCAAAMVLAGCGGDDSTQTPTKTGHYQTTVSSTLAIQSDDATLWVVNQDSDSVSVVDVKTRSLVTEILLADAPPAPDPSTNRYEPKVTPRGVALLDDGRKVYVAGETANAIYVIDGATRAVTKKIPVSAEPIGVAVAPDGSAVYVATFYGGQLIKIDPKTDTVSATLDLSEKPWGVSVSADGNSVFVSHIMLESGISTVDAHSMALRTKVVLKDEPQSDPVNKLLPNGVARGLFQVVPRPGTGELWVPHMLLAVLTPEDDDKNVSLDFESTVFPTVSTLAADGSAEARRLLFKPLAVAGAAGSFSDIVSGPHALAFTPGGTLALVAMGQSEDLLVFDAETGTERQLVRPLPSAMLEGVIVDHAGKYAYVDGRNTHDVSVLKIDETSASTPVSVDGASINRIVEDPMPPGLRLGQRLFYTANQAKFPITKNFWVACTTCHIEGGSDAVTWRFFQGPRDTPSNFGGMLGTGFLLKQAARNLVQQYDETIRVEQGGNYDYTKPSQQGDLNALADYVNYAIPFPQNPYRSADGSLTAAQANGKVVYGQVCETCHYGEMLTDSGANNPELDLSGEVLLHDIGTCVTKGDFKDRKMNDVEGNTREACMFDTPTLRGIFATAPYFHDGSSATLRDVVDRLPFSASLPDSDKADLVEYLKTL